MKKIGLKIFNLKKNDLQNVDFSRFDAVMIDFKKRVKDVFEDNEGIWLIFFALCIISGVELFSASSVLAYKSENYMSIIFRHMTFLFAGMILAVITQFIPIKVVKFFGYISLIISFLLLLYVSLKGVETNDAKRWIQIGQIRFQPSSLANLSLVIFSASFIDKIKNKPTKIAHTSLSFLSESFVEKINKNKIIKNRYFFILMTISAVIMGLIFFENFSTAAILGTTIFLMMWVAHVNWKKLVSILGILFFILLLLFIMVRTVPRQSIPSYLSFLDRSYVWDARIQEKMKETEETRYIINDKNRQVQNGRIAIARGRFLGVFPGNSVQRDYLPNAYDDFIFSIIIEEMGLLGAIFIMVLYLVFLFRTGKIAKATSSSFSSLLIMGLGLLVALQATVHMFVGSGFGLVTGQPLPLISRGGTSVIVTSLIFGIILAVVRENREKQNKKEPALKRLMFRILNYKID